MAVVAMLLCYGVGVDMIDHASRLSTFVPPSHCCAKMKSRNQEHCGLLMMNDTMFYLRSGTQGARLINLSYTMVNNAK